jgi:hypothetical protein
MGQPKTRKIVAVGFVQARNRINLVTSWRHPDAAGVTVTVQHDDT